MLFLNSVNDYVSSEIFTGLVTKEKLLILTQDFKLYCIDEIFGDEGYEQGQYNIVGYHDSLMLFAQDKTVIHWEILSFSK